MPDRNTFSTCNGDRVYQAIKARAVACDFDPGEPIRLSPLASSLGVSTTPIRAALNMLVAEGLVRREPQKGFIAMSLSPERFQGLYSLNQLLLQTALTARAPDGGRFAAATAAVNRISNELDDEAACTAETTAKCTGDLFRCIAELAGKPHITEAVERVNDSLEFIREYECRQPGTVRAELMVICELFLAEQLNATVKAIADYHASRKSMTPDLLVSLRQQRRENPRLTQ